MGLIEAIEELLKLRQENARLAVKIKNLLIENQELKQQGAIKDSLIETYRDGHERYHQGTNYDQNGVVRHRRNIS